MLKSGNEGSGCNGDGKRFVVPADEKLLFEIACVLMRFVHVALLIVNADHCV